MYYLLGILFGIWLFALIHSPFVVLFLTALALIMAGFFSTSGKGGGGYGGFY